MKYEVHTLGERFVVEQGVEVGDIELSDAEDIAMVFHHGCVVTIPTTRGDITFNVPDGGIPVWVESIKPSDRPEQLI